MQRGNQSYTYSVQAPNQLHRERTTLSVVLNSAETSMGTNGNIRTSDLRNKRPDQDPLLPTGVRGLDGVLGGGLTANRLYLIEGTPGTGKTTMALQFLMHGAAQGEPGLYITLSETAAELREVAASHGWSLEGIEIFELISEDGLEPEGEQSILHPSEVELGETTQRIIDKVVAAHPSRVVFDSLSELRLLAQSALRYRRQILALKYFFATRKCTVLMLDVRTTEPGDPNLHSLVHGVIQLEQTSLEYGPERRRLRVVKMRGIKFCGGLHDFDLNTGGIRVYPRLIASEHERSFEQEWIPTGSEQLDRLLGGGLLRGCNTLLTGPSGAGKTTTSMRCTLTALERGERAAYFLFDEGVSLLVRRCASLGMNLQSYLDSGQLLLRQVDPGTLSPGEFSCNVRDAVEQEQVSIVVIDSLDAYMQAMPGEKFLLLQMHELLTYLNQQGVVTLMVLGQHGLVGEVRSDIDLSYLSDSILLFRFFEAKGRLHTAVAALKSRAAHHERSIREFRLSPGGISLGEALLDFEGVLSGLPNYRGATPMLQPTEDA
jgi:circadian clock protein KaiC